jgi:hypothetical protein
VCLPGGSRGASASEAESPPGWTRRRSSSPQHSTRPPPTLPVGALGARPGVAPDRARQTERFRGRTKFLRSK